MVKVNRIRVIFEIGKILAETREHLNIGEIKTELLNTYERDVAERTIKQYLVDLASNFDMALSVKRGRYGGYSLSDEWRSKVASLSTSILSTDQKNGINDAFEIALRSANFHYSKELKQAKSLIGANRRWKDNDFEYYIGKQNTDSKTTSIINIFKDGIRDKRVIKMYSKFDETNIPKGFSDIKPQFIVHDQDETFIIGRDYNKQYVYQNVLNIKKAIKTDKRFGVYADDNIKKHINDFSLNIKGEYNIKFKIKSNKGNKTFELVHYEFRDNSESNSEIKDVTFFEKYKGIGFLFRMYQYIDIIEIDDTLMDEWNKKIDSLKYI